MELPACFPDESVPEAASLLLLVQLRVDALQREPLALGAWGGVRPDAREDVLFPELEDAPSVERSAAPAQAGLELVVLVRLEVVQVPCTRDAAPSAA
jgi:hypothetical protein